MSEDRKPIRYAVAVDDDGKHVRLQFDKLIGALLLTPKDTMRLSKLLREAAHEIPDGLKPVKRVKKKV